MRKLSMIIAVLGMMISPMMELQAQQDVQNSVTGTWINTVDSNTIEIYVDSNKNISGEIIALKVPIDSETGKPRLDKHNPDINLRKLPVIGLIFMTNFEINQHDWDKGSYYDYTDGKIYNKCVMDFLNVTKQDTLRITEVIPAPQAPVGGKTTYWTRKKSSTNTD